MYNVKSKKHFDFLGIGLVFVKALDENDLEFTGYRFSIFDKRVLLIINSKNNWVDDDGNKMFFKIKNKVLYINKFSISF